MSVHVSAHRWFRCPTWGANPGSSVRVACTLITELSFSPSPFQNTYSWDSFTDLSNHCLLPRFKSCLCTSKSILGLPGTIPPTLASLTFSLGIIAPFKKILSCQLQHSMHLRLQKVLNSKPGTRAQECSSTSSAQSITFHLEDVSHTKGRRLVCFSLPSESTVFKPWGQSETNRLVLI